MDLSCFVYEMEPRRTAVRILDNLRQELLLRVSIF